LSVEAVTRIFVQGPLLDALDAEANEEDCDIG
jgi:hypothetical protein